MLFYNCAPYFKLIVTCVFLTNKPAHEALQAVDWKLLLLIGSSLGLSESVVQSGLAREIGEGIFSLNVDPVWILMILYIVVMVSPTFVYVLCFIYLLTVGSSQDYDRVDYKYCSSCFTSSHCNEWC